MRITVNGKTEELDGRLTLAELVRRHDLTPDRVAVEVNRELVQRADYGGTTLADGDVVEIVTFVGGG
jgi:thiamine biosynthesis protein ThiS